jgi:hypothetical protein
MEEGGRRWAVAGAGLEERKETLAGRRWPGGRGRARGRRAAGRVGPAEAADGEPCR